MKKILVIDDSALMRKQLRIILEGAGYEVDIARNGEEGLEKIKSGTPDAVTLDINMPVMDGLTCLSHIMTEMPLPVVMVSSLTEKGALSTFEALEMGAIDYVAKPGGTVSLNISDVEKELLNKIKIALKSRIRKAHTLRNRIKAVQNKTINRIPKPLKANKPKNKPIEDGIVIIGVSTGGPGTLESVLSILPRDFPWPIIVSQHMPAKFTEVFAKRLDKICALKVKEINRAMNLEAGTVLIARGDADIKLIQRKNIVMVTSIPPSSKFLWHPSVELMAQSVGEYYEEDSIICVQLTGMGNDGAKTMAELHAKGARTIAESEQTAIVFGMPKELIALGGADKVLASDEIAQQLINWVY